MMMNCRPVVYDKMMKERNLFLIYRYILILLCSYCVMIALGLYSSAKYYHFTVIESIKPQIVSDWKWKALHEFQFGLSSGGST